MYNGVLHPEFCDLYIRECQDLQSLDCTSTVVPKRGRFPRSSRTTEVHEEPKYRSPEVRDGGREDRDVPVWSYPTPGWSRFYWSGVLGITISVWGKSELIVKGTPVDVFDKGHSVQVSEIPNLHLTSWWYESINTR